MNSATTTVSLLANDTRTVDMACTNKRVFGGGYDATADPSLVSISSFPINQTTWRVILRTGPNGAPSFSFRIYAVCATSN